MRIYTKRQNSEIPTTRSMMQDSRFRKEKKILFNNLKNKLSDTAFNRFFDA